MAAGIPARLTAAARPALWQDRRRRFPRLGRNHVVARTSDDDHRVWGTRDGAATRGPADPDLSGSRRTRLDGVAHAISRVTTPIVMAVIYFAVLTPVGLLRRTIGSNPLTNVELDSTFWQHRPPNARRSASMERQF